VKIFQVTSGLFGTDQVISGQVLLEQVVRIGQVQV